MPGQGRFRNLRAPPHSPESAALFARRLLVIPWILAVLAATELALEVRAHRRGWETLVFGVPAPPAAGSGASAYGPTGDFPFRSRIVARERGPDVRRYWIASASYAEDTGLPPDEIFPDLLAVRLSSGDRPVQVLNASRAGAAMASNIATLSALAPDWEPDVAILYQMSLDVNFLSSQLLGGAAAATPNDAEVAPALVAARGRAVRLIESTTLWQQLKAHLTSRLAAARLLADGLPPEAHVRFEAKVREFVRAARAAGAIPVLCTFATSHGRAHLPDFPSDRVLFLMRYNPHLSLAGWVETVESLNRSIREIAAEEGVPLVDVAAAAGGRPELFRDFVHFTTEGHAVVAEALAASLAAEPEREASP